MTGKRYNEKRGCARIDDMGIESFERLLVVAEARYSLSFCLVSRCLIIWTLDRQQTDSLASAGQPRCPASPDHESSRAHQRQFGAVLRKPVLEGIGWSGSRPAAQEAG